VKSIHGVVMTLNFAIGQGRIQTGQEYAGDMVKIG
jgi:hypothetical protein